MSMASSLGDAQLATGQRGVWPKPYPPAPVLFKEKLNDVVGLCLNPPENAIVLCVDGKSSIQALDRAQPGLPLKQGLVATV